MLSFSGGKDSVAMYLLAMENGIDFIPVCADTGNEHEITMDYVRGFHLQTGGPEVRIIKADFSGDFEHRRMFVARDKRVKKQRVVKRHKDGTIKNVKVKPVRYTNKQKRRILENLVPSGNPFLDLMMLKGRFASSMAAFCTEKLKRDQFIEQVYFPFIDAGKIVVSWQGVRANESARRAKYPIYDTPGGGLWNYRPIHTWLAADTFEIMRKHNILPNPLYKMGMSRVGCMPCVNCKKDELNEIAIRFPEHIDRIKDWEIKVSLCARNNKATFFHASKNGGGITGIDGVVEWSRTGKGGRTFDFFKSIDDGLSCSSAYIFSFISVYVSMFDFLHSSSNVMQFFPDRLAHYVGQRQSLGKLPQGLVHQGLVIAAVHFGARFEDRQSIIVNTHGDAAFAALFGLQLHQVWNFRNRFGVGKIIVVTHSIEPLLEWINGRKLSEQFLHPVAHKSPLRAAHDLTNRSVQTALRLLHPGLRAPMRRGQAGSFALLQRKRRACGDWRRPSWGQRLFSCGLFYVQLCILASIDNVAVQGYALPVALIGGNGFDSSEITGAEAMRQKRCVAFFMPFAFSAIRNFRIARLWRVVFGRLRGLPVPVTRSVNPNIIRRPLLGRSVRWQINFVTGACS